MFCITSHKCEDLPYLKHKSGIPGTNLILLSTTHLKEDYIFRKDGVSFSKSSLCWLLLIAEQAILRGTTAFPNQPWRKEAQPFPKSCAQLREKPKRNSSANFPVWSENTWWSVKCCKQFPPIFNWISSDSRRDLNSQHFTTVEEGEKGLNYTELRCIYTYKTLFSTKGPINNWNFLYLSDQCLQTPATHHKFGHQINSNRALTDLVYCFLEAHQNYFLIAKKV